MGKFASKEAGAVVVDWADITGIPSTFAPSSHSNTSHSVAYATAASVSNIDNTSDVNKPVSTAQQTALDLKANKANETHTGTTTVSVIAIGSYTFEIVSGQLEIKYGGVVKYRFNSSGILEAVDHKNGLV